MMIEAMMTWVMCSAAAVGAGSAENAGGRPLTGGLVAPGPDNTATLAALLPVLRADAARRSGLDAARLDVLPATDVTWSDGALGCPQPGRHYTQALVPGWRVRIVAGDQTLDYHASRRGQWLLCPAGRAVTPTPGPVQR